MFILHAPLSLCSLKTCPSNAVAGQAPECPAGAKATKIAYLHNNLEVGLFGQIAIFEPR